MFILGGPWPASGTLPNQMKRLLIAATGKFLRIVAVLIAYAACIAISARHAAVCNPRYIDPEGQLQAMEAAGMEINKEAKFTVSQLMKVGRAQDALKLVYEEMGRFCQ